MLQLHIHLLNVVYYNKVQNYTMLTPLRWQFLVRKIKIPAISIGIGHIQDITCHMSSFYVCSLCTSEVGRKISYTELAAAQLKWVNPLYGSVWLYTTASSDLSLVQTTVSGLRHPSIEQAGSGVLLLYCYIIKCTLM